MLPSFAPPPRQGSCAQALLLALFVSAPKLRKAILEASPHNEELTYAVKGVFEALSKPGTGKVSAEKVWELIGEDKLESVDARELFIAMCELFDAEIPTKTPAMTSFGYTVDNEIVSVATHERRVDKLEDEILLGLSIPNGSRELKQLLANHFIFETLSVEKGNGYVFQTGDVNVEINITPEDAEKGSILASLPNEVFVVQLQRYTFDVVHAVKTKFDDRIVFPKKLTGGELAKLCCGVKDEWHQKSFDRVNQVKELTLTAVICHQTGHGYSGYVLADGKQWFHINELSEVTACTESEALEGSYGDGSQGGRSGYLLFYTVSGGGGTPGVTTGAISKQLEKPKAREPPTKAKSIESPRNENLRLLNEPHQTETKAGASSGGGCCSIM